MTALIDCGCTVAWLVLRDIVLEGEGSEGLLTHTWGVSSKRNPNPTSKPMYMLVGRFVPPLLARQGLGLALGGRFQLCKMRTPRASDRL